MAAGGVSPRALDAVFVVALAAWAVATWRYGTPTSGIPMPADLPAWATTQDMLFDGFDAGNWAQQAIAFQGGLTDRLDPHRTPTWTLLTALAQALTGHGPALAGHLVNHLLRVAFGPVVYAAARLLGLGRVAAFAAGLAVILHPEMRYNAGSFGVDMTTSVVWIATVTAAMAVRGRPAWAVLAGVVAGLGVTAHFTTIPVPIPAAMLVFAGAQPEARGRVLTMFAVATVTTTVLVFQVLPPMPLDVFVGSIWVGVVDKESVHVGASTLQRGLAVLENARRHALPELLRWFDGQYAGVWPWAAVGALLGLGVVAPGLVPREAGLSWLANRAPRRVRLAIDAAARGARTGLPVALLVSPIPVLFAVSASHRYSNTLVPVLILLAVRGAATLGAALDRAVGRRGIFEGAAALLLVAPTFGTWVVTPRGDPDRDRLSVALGGYLDANWPEGTEVATVLTEASAMAGEMSCPPTKCPSRIAPGELESCLAETRALCRGTSDTLPYVIAVREPEEQRSPPREAMDDFVLGRFPVVKELESPTMRVVVVAVPRK